MTRLRTSTLAILTLATLFSLAHENRAIAQQSQNPYYFGMNIQLVRDGFGRAVLQVASVTPGGGGTISQVNLRFVNTQAVIAGVEGFVER